MTKVIALFLILFASTPSIAQDQSHVDEAQKLLRLMNADDAIDQAYDMVYGQMSQMADQMGITDEQRPIFDRYMHGVVQVMKEELSWAKMEPEMIKVYVAVYSEDEIRELNEFYASPLGQKFVAKMPELMQETMGMTQQMMQSMLPRLTELQEQLVAELRQAREQ